MAGQVKIQTIGLTGPLKKRKLYTAEPWHSEWVHNKAAHQYRALFEIYYKPQNSKENPVLLESVELEGVWKVESGVCLHLLWKQIWGEVNPINQYDQYYIAAEPKRAKIKPRSSDLQAAAWIYGNNLTKWLTEG